MSCEGNKHISFINEEALDNADVFPKTGFEDFDNLFYKIYQTGSYHQTYTTNIYITKENINIECTYNPYKIKSLHDMINKDVYHGGLVVKYDDVNKFNEKYKLTLYILMKLNDIIKNFSSVFTFL